MDNNQLKDDLLNLQTFLKTNLEKYKKIQEEVKKETQSLDDTLDMVNNLIEKI